jgi:hypothetical protein
MARLCLGVSSELFFLSSLLFSSFFMAGFGFGFRLAVVVVVVVVWYWRGVSALCVIVRAFRYHGKRSGRRLISVFEFGVFDQGGWLVGWW